MTAVTAPASLMCMSISCGGTGLRPWIDLALATFESTVPLAVLGLLPLAPPTAPGHARIAWTAAKRTWHSELMHS